MTTTTPPPTATQQTQPNPVRRERRADPDLDDDDLADLPPTQFELDRLRDERTISANERRERRRLRMANRRAGHSEPRPGDVMFVSIADRNLARRTRAGVRFERGARVEVKILDRTDDEIRALQLAGAAVVNVYGAERILEDEALAVRSNPGTADMDMARLRQANQDLEAENQLQREELKRLREARQSAVDTGDGRPNRLQAARAAAATTPDAGGHGDEDFTAPKATKTTK